MLELKHIGSFIMVMNMECKQSFRMIEIIYGSR